MKVLCNFQSGKVTQERMILERFLHSSKKLSFRPEEIPRVLSVIHELVYTIIHEHIPLRKRDLAGQENLELQLILEGPVMKEKSGLYWSLENLERVKGVSF